MYTLERLPVRHRANTKRQTTIHFHIHSQSRVTVNLTHAYVWNVGGSRTSTGEKDPRLHLNPGLSCCEARFLTSVMPSNVTY